ncbi:hypothetical protein RA268_28130, partial [Pseudomonas syringae pv. tagetis]
GGGGGRAGGFCGVVGGCGWVGLLWGFFGLGGSWLLGVGCVCGGVVGVWCVLSGGWVGWVLWFVGFGCVGFWVVGFVCGVLLVGVVVGWFVVLVVLGVGFFRVL